MGSRANSPITVALVGDYDVVFMSVANMFDQYRDRVVVAELDLLMSTTPSTSFCMTPSPRRNRITKRSPL